MKKFDQLHITERLELCLIVIGWLGVHKCPSLARLAAARNQSVAELWEDACAEVGLDVCEPWTDYPAGPIKEAFANARGADREISPEWKQRAELIYRMAARFRKLTKQ